MSIITSIFSPALVFFHPNQVDNKKQLFEFIANSLELWNSELKHQDILAALRQRERIGHTAIIPSVAIPHARMATLTEPVGVITTLNQPVIFDTDGDFPVTLVFTLLVPTEATDSHLQTLKELAQLLQNKNDVDSLLQTTNKEQLWQTFTKITQVPH